MCTHPIQYGYKVAAAPRWWDKLKTITAETGVLPMRLDVTGPDAVSSPVTRVQEQLGAITLLVKSA